MKTRVKGFTLVELLVVMAIFSIVMFGAMQLIDPAGKIFTFTYKQETLASSASNITDYLQESLRYAEVVNITTEEVGIDEVQSFVDSYYDGKLLMTGTSTGSYAEGEVYVIKIDNANGGIISSYQYHYRVGDSWAFSGYQSSEDANVENSFFDTADSATLTSFGLTSSMNRSTVELTSYEEYAVNKAFYDNGYHFNVSLGYYELDDSTNELSQISAISQDNFILTVTGYSYNTTKGECGRTQTTLESGETKTTFDVGYIYTASCALTNCTLPIYAVHNYDWCTTGNTYKILCSGNNCSCADEKFDSIENTKIQAGRQKASQEFVVEEDINTATADCYYIIYSYIEDSFVKAS